MSQNFVPFKTFNLESAVGNNKIFSRNKYLFHHDKHNINANSVILSWIIGKTAKPEMINVFVDILLPSNHENNDTFIMCFHD